MTEQTPIATEQTEAAVISKATLLTGQQAWAWLKENGRRSFDKWKRVGETVLGGKQECAKKAGGFKGRRYNTEFHQWNAAHGFGDINKADRAKLLLVMENLAEVEAWLAKQPDDKRAKWNHPDVIWRRFKCPTTGASCSDQAHATERDVSQAGKATDDEDEEAAEKKWQDGLHLRALKSIGQATLNGAWLLGPPEPGLIAEVRKAAEAWNRLVAMLEAELKKADKQKKSRKQKNGEAPRTEASL